MEGHKLTGENVTHLLCLFFVVVVGICTWYSHVTLLTLLLTNDLHLMVLGSHSILRGHSLTLV